MFMRTRVKGQSLVEVIVALGIIVIVFTGTITLVVNVMNLNLNSRDVTQATALTEKKMGEAVSGIRSDCTVDIAGLSVSGNNVPVTLGGKSFTPVVTFQSVGRNQVSNTFVLDPTGLFIRITSTVTWRDRGGVDRSFSVERILRKNI